MARKWIARTLGLAALGAAGLAAWNATALRSHYAARQLAVATTDDARSQQVQVLLDLGDDGLARLAEALKGGDAATCQAIGGALRQRLAAGDFARPACVLLDPPDLGDAGQEAVLQLLPEFLKSTDEAVTAKCRAAVERGLKSSPGAKALAARLSVHPRVGLAAAVQPLLADPDAAVRAAALTAVGTTGDTLSDEDLFRWMNDPDAQVRQVCAAVLETRGRTPDEIDFGRRLMHPQARVRLELLLDLAHEPSRDIGPWLERLSRDDEPAVRVGAVRVASERKLLYADWADKLAADDPNPLVRQIVSFHRRKAAGLVQPTGYRP